MATSTNAPKTLTLPRWTVSIAWTEGRERRAIRRGHGHKSHWAAERCAGKWRRRIAGDSE